MLRNVWTSNYVQTYKIAKQPILVSKRNSIEKKRPKFLIALGDLLCKVWFVQLGFSKFVFEDN